MDWPKLCETDWFKSRPMPAQNAIRQYPYNKFYQKKDESHTPIRIYGMMENADGTVDHAHVMTAHIMMPINIIGGYSLDDLEPVDEWSENQLLTIKTMGKNRQDSFLKKDGVFAIMLAMAPRD